MAVGSRVGGREPYGPEWPERAWVTNRDRTNAPRSGLHWCGGCDANLVGAGERCRVCRNVARPHVMAKDTSA